MKTRLHRWAKLLCIPVITASAAFGCGSGFAEMLAPASATTAENPLVRVDLVGIEDDEVKLMVYNTSGALLTIDRDAFVLQTPGGIVRRKESGARGWEIPPGGAHDVTLNYDMEDVKLPPGQLAYLLIDPAIRVNGQFVGLPPIVLQGKKD